MVLWYKLVTWLIKVNDDKLNFGDFTTDVSNLYHWSLGLMEEKFKEYSTHTQTGDNEVPAPAYDLILDYLRNVLCSNINNFANLAECEDTQ